MRATVAQAERNVAMNESMAALQTQICQKIADLVDSEIPEFLFRTIGENQYQAELLTAQQQVDILILCLHILVQQWYEIREFDILKRQPRPQ